jgi:hypothetical protein
MKARAPVGAGGARPDSWVRAATAPPIRARLAPSARRRGEDKVEAAATGARIQALIAPDTPPVTTAAPAPQVAHSTRIRDCRRSSRSVAHGQRRQGRKRAGRQGQPDVDADDAGGEGRRAGREDHRRQPAQPPQVRRPEAPVEDAAWSGLGSVLERGAVDGQGRENPFRECFVVKA